MDTIISKADRAQVLVQALPYIQQYYNRVVVIKYGGHAMENEELKAKVMEDIVLLQLVGVRVVLVHGGGPDIDVVARRGVGKHHAVAVEYPPARSFQRHIPHPLGDRARPEFLPLRDHDREHLAHHRRKGKSRKQ